MNPIVQLVDERVKANFADADFICTAPCVVKQILADDMVQVEMVSDKRKFTVLNGSGVQLGVGDEAKLAYRGYISNTNSYIVAARGQHGVAVAATLNSSLADGSEVKIRQTSDAFLIAVDVESDVDISSGDIVLATKTNLFSYPVSGIDTTYYNVLQDDAGNTYTLEARLSDGDADSAGNKYGKLEVVVVAGDTITSGTKLHGQIFAL